MTERERKKIQKNRLLTLGDLTYPPLPLSRFSQYLPKLRPNETFMTRQRKLLLCFNLTLSGPTPLSEPDPPSPRPLFSRTQTQHNVIDVFLQNIPPPPFCPPFFKSSNQTNDYSQLNKIIHTQQKMLSIFSICERQVKQMDCRHKNRQADSQTDRQLCRRTESCKQATVHMQTDGQTD